MFIVVYRPLSHSVGSEQHMTIPKAHTPVTAWILRPASLTSTFGTAIDTVKMAGDVDIALKADKLKWNRAGHVIRTAGQKTPLSSRRTIKGLRRDGDFEIFSKSNKIILIIDHCRTLSHNCNALRMS